MRAGRVAIGLAAALSTLATTGRGDDSTGAPGPSAETASPSSGAPDTTYLFEAAARTGYASTPIAGGVSPFGAGFGARAGFDVWRLYLGATVMDYLGGSDVGATDQALLLGVEVGYNGRIGPYLTLRPRLGVGDTILSHTEPPPAGFVDVVSSASGGSSSGGVTTTVKNVYVEPGLTVLLSYRRFFAGVSGSVFVLPGILYGPAPAQTTTWFCYSLELEVGFRL